MGKKVYIIYTGGTIGMIRTKYGYAPKKNYLEKKIKLVLRNNTQIIPNYDINEYSPLLDSSNISQKQWVKIAKDIEKNYFKYDGFVILHGTDTMAYTASSLSFMLENLGKPVIMTGSQIPLCEVRNDANENLITSMIIAGYWDIPEVCIYFGDKLYRGCRTVKNSADDLDAFCSPNYPPLANIGVNININENLILKKNKNNNIKVIEFGEHPIAILKIFPGIDVNVLENILKPPIKGLVLETFGSGNVPNIDSRLFSILKDAVNRGVIIVATTQCLRGKVHIGKYEAGKMLEKAGIISGNDMTTEAALAKLYYLFSKDLDVKEIKEIIQTNICGEMTENNISKFQLN